jgi:Fe-S cluster biogenesis protein NfuA/nitrite reductase/ring-hydroxylating ferredoxin subunit
MGDPEAPDQLRAAGERIDVLLDAAAAGGTVARERAEELVRLMADLYGAGLERVLEIIHDAGRLDDDALAALAKDNLVSSLLLVHGLHPYDMTTRVEEALESVRPYLGSHGGDVELIDVSDEGTVRLRLLGSCDGCPSSSVTLKLAVEGAIESAAPEVINIEVEQPEPEPASAGASTGSSAGSFNGGPLIPVDALRSRLGGDSMAEGVETQGSSWERLPQVADLAAGALMSIAVGSTQVLLCRIGSDLFAYLDRCARCSDSLGSAVLSRRLGAAVGEAVLRCPGCQAHYDVRHAGACLDDDALHLEPLPLLTTSGVTTVAIPTPVSA